MEDYYEYLDSNGVTTLYKLIKDDTVALIDSYSVTVNGITTTLDTHINDSDIHTPISVIEGMIDTRVSGLVNSAPETLDTLKELSDALGNDTNFATTVANQIGNKASKDSVYTKEETDNLLEDKANNVHSHVVKDITDFPTIPTKVSELSNDSGYITSVSWEDVTSKPELSQVAISGSYSDLSGTPIIPTKTSQLINDSGFLTSSSGVITSVSWSDINDKPNFSTVATSGSYTDLSNTPTIPTKLSQLENDTGFINALTDVVDTKSNQTINGTKTFTSTPFVSGGGATIGIYLKNTAIARNEVPSTTYYSVLRTLDKNDEILGDYVVMKTDKGATNAQINIRSEDSNGNQLINTLNFSMSNDNSSVSFAPSVNNKVSLGTSAYKWAKVYSDDVVHTSGNELISGNKSFSNTIHRYADITTSGEGQVYRFDDTNSTPCGDIYNNIHWYNNAVYNRHGAYNAKSGKDMEIDITSNDSGVGMAYLSGSASNGNLKTVTSDTGYPGIATMGWVNNPATSTNVVHRSGNETINGAKTFTDAYATTQAITDNSNRIATTAWVRNYVNSGSRYSVARSSAVGASAVGSSISAYYSNATTLTAQGDSSSSGGYYPSDYSDYIDISPREGTIYTGSQLFGTLNASASGSKYSYGTSSGPIYQTTAKATATFSGAFSSSAKYLCTTANAVRFRAYVSQGTNSDIGTASVVDNSSTKSIFTRIE